uniref:Putative neutral endopeptidase-like protein n=1 Tax=Amblyomma americanum TaxID=6943 RepID=A0A0C9RR81_AMBAM
MKHKGFVCLQAWFFFLAAESRQPKENENFLLCSTDVCKERAKQITESITKSPNPCEDFYSFACGAWETQHKDFADGASYGIHDELNQKVKETFKDILERRVPDTTKQNITDKVRIIYQSCMAFQNASDRPDGLAKVLKSYGLAEWPIFKNTTRNITVPENATEMLLKIGIRGVFDITVRRDPENPTSHILQLRQPKGTSSEERDRKDAIKEAALFIDSNASNTTLAEFTEDIATYGRKLKSLRSSFGPNNIDTEIRMAPIAEIERNFSNIPLLELLRKEFLGLKIDITENDSVELYPLAFYRNFNDFLNTVEPIRMLNYAGARVVSEIGYQASKAFRKLFLDVRKYYNKYSPRERWEECIQLIRNEMPEAMDYLYTCNTLTTLQ